MFTNQNQKERMTEKGSWSCKPEDLFSACNNDSSKEQKRLASDNATISDCFKSSNVDSSGRELCADDPIVGDKCLVRDDNVSQYSINHISQPDNELSFVENDGWLNMENFEDVDTMMLNFDLAFGMESLNNEEEFSWLSSSHGTEGTDNDALKSDFKFSSDEVSPLKSISDYMDMNENTESQPIHDCNNKESPFDKKRISEMDVDHDGGPASSPAFSESDMKSCCTDYLMPKQKVQGKLSKQSVGKRKNGYLKDGDSDHPFAHVEQHANLKQPYEGSSSGVTFQDTNDKQRPSMDTDSFGCMQLQTPLMHPDYSHTSNYTSLLPTSSEYRSEHDRYPSPSFKESSYASNMGNSHCPPLEAATFETYDERESLYLCHDAELLIRGFKSENMKNPLPFKSPGLAQKVGHQFENENEGHSEVGGVSIGFSSEIESSNVQESSSMSSAPDDFSVEATSFLQLQQALDQLDIKTKLCIRDSLYRLAKSADHKPDVNASGQMGDDVEACNGTMTQGANRYTGFVNIEANTNPIDRSMAHLLFHRPSNPSNSPINDTPFKSNCMIQGSVTHPPIIITEKQICQEESSAGVEMKP